MNIYDVIRDQQQQVKYIKVILLSLPDTIVVYDSGFDIQVTDKMTHPLQNTWVLWEHKEVQKQEDWKNSMREVCEFSTVEEFWRYWSFVPRPSEVLFDGNSRKVVDGRSIEAFSLFKKGIRPEWEDPANRSGSDLSCRKTFQPDLLDLYWENLVLALIGESIDESDEICGVRVVDKSAKKGGSNRTLFKIELWLRSPNAEVGDKIRLRMLEILADGEPTKPGQKPRLPDFEFKRHT